MKTQKNIVCAEGIASAIHCLYGSIWPTKGHVKFMLGNLPGALLMLGVKGFAVRSYGRSMLWYFMEPDFVWEPAARHLLADIVSSPIQIPAGPLPVSGGIHCSLTTCWVPLGYDGETQIPSFENFCALFWRPTGDLQIDEIDFGIYRKSIAPMLLDVFRQRERRLMSFPGRTSELYWNEAMVGDGIFSPPWDELSYKKGNQEGRRFTTTVCVDLRKSTFCMDQVIDPVAYARWLDDFLTDLIRIGHDYGGVFDKFTGDGGLIHFLEEECQKLDKKEAVVAATECSIALIEAINGRFPSLKDNLRNYSDRIGVGVAIANGDASWSVDHRDNPIIVGHNVVDACRICNGTPPGRIRMSNGAYSKLRSLNDKLAILFNRIHLGETKEWDADMKVIGFELAMNGVAQAPACQ